MHKRFALRLEESLLLSLLAKVSLGSKHCGTPAAQVRGTGFRGWIEAEPFETASQPGLILLCHPQQKPYGTPRTRLCLPKCA